MILDVIVNKLSAGFNTGFDRNETSAYRFELSERNNIAQEAETETYVIDGKTYEIENAYNPEDVDYDNGWYEIRLNGIAISEVLDHIPTEDEVRQILGL